MYRTLASAARRRVHLPLRGGRRNEERACDSTGLAQRQPERAHRGGQSGSLHVKDRVRIERVIRRGVLDFHLFESDLEFLRQKHRLRRVDALPHLDHWHH
jgi:hypothetical protein